LSGNLNRRDHGDGGIDERSPGHYRLRWRVDGRRFTKAFHGSIGEARKELRRLIKSADDGQHVAPDKITVERYLTDWLASDTGISPKTRERYRQLAEHQIIPHLGATALQKLRPGHLTEWHTELLRAGGADSRSLAARTVGHAHRLLHTALAHAARAELVVRNVASLVHPPKVQTKEIAILPATEIAQVLAGLAGHRLMPIAALAIGSGLRRGEPCGLVWGDVDLAAGRLRVSGALEQTRSGLRLKEPKTRHGRRSLALPEFAATALRNHWRDQQKQRLTWRLGRAGSADWVFTLTDSSPWKPDYLSRHWKRTLASRKLPRIGLHALRHYHASALIAAGIDPLTISRRLGHGTAAFTLATYGHLFADTDAAAATALDATLGNTK
jgi:integrase